MKIKKRGKVILFNGLLLMLIFVLIIFLIPINPFKVLAYSVQYPNYSYITIGTVNNKVTDAVSLGEKYDIPNAYIGGYNEDGNNVIIGEATSNAISGIENLTSSVRVSYETQTFFEYETEGDEGYDIENSVIIGGNQIKDGYYGYFYATKTGAYTITYSYSYEKDGKIYWNYYDLKVESVEIDDKNENVEENYPPTLYKIEIEDETFIEEYLQGEDITLPTVTVIDDYVDFMNYYVSIYSVKEDGSRIEIITPSNSRESKDTNDGTYTVFGGTFNAAFAGDYVASIELSDFNNTKIVVFTHYTARERLIIQDPVANVSFENQTVELDDTPVISLPTPTISYSIDNSLDYESYKLGNYTIKPEFVLIGVDENGNATDYENAYGRSSFTPTEKGVYTVKYTTRLRIFSTDDFTYVEGSADDKINGVPVNYFTELDEIYSQDGYLIKTENETTYRVYAPDTLSEPQTYTEYLVTKNSEGIVQVTKVGGTDADTITISQDRYNYWRNNLKMYVWESDNFTITVNDTLGPKIKNYDYVDAISSDALEQENEGAARGYKLHVQGIEATDASGIDYSRSTVTITRTYKVDGSTRTSVDSLTDKINGEDFYISQNGTVTIAYTVYDNNGNSSTAEYVIRAGDNTNPIIRVNTVDESDFIATTYSLSDFQDGLFVVDLTKLSFSDDRTPNSELIIEYELINDDIDESINIETKNDSHLAYKITEVGNYIFSVTVTDEVGNSVTKKFNFEVTGYEIGDLLINFKKQLESTYAKTDSIVISSDDFEFGKFSPYKDNYIELIEIKNQNGELLNYQYLNNSYIFDSFDLFEGENFVLSVLVADLYGNYTIEYYDLYVDKTNPTLDIKNVLDKKTYTDSESLSIDLRTIMYTDNSELSTNNKPSVKLINLDNGQEVEGQLKDDLLIFNSFSEYGIGNYKLEIQVTDNYGNTATDNLYLNVIRESNYDIIILAIIIPLSILLVGILICLTLYFTIKKYRYPKI